MKKILLASIFIFLIEFSFAQESKPLQEFEIAIAQLFDSLFLNNGAKFTQTDSAKIQLSINISKLFDEILNEASSFKYSFQKIKHLGIIKSQDKHVKIYTWNIKLNNGNYKYYGYIQKKKAKKIQVFKLQDQTTILEKEPLENIIFTDKNWLGMLYYNIVDFKHNGKKYYLILGYRNKGYSLRNKFIDVLSFSKSKVKFGKKIFKTDKRKFHPQRIIFKYSAKFSFKMNYDPRYKMVVFDHLTPLKSKLKGYYSFYGPDGSYDAYQYLKGKWTLQSDVWIEGSEKKEGQKNPKSTIIYKKK